MSGAFAGPFDTVAQFAAATLVPSTNVVRTNGYYAAGDGGDALYIKAGAPGAGPGKVQSADGQWWVLSGNDLNVIQFGADPTGAADSSAAFNNAIAFVEALPYGGSIRAPRGDYKLNSTVGGTGNHVRLFGDGKRVTNLIYQQTTGTALSIGDVNGTSNPQYWEVDNLSISAASQMTQGQLLLVENGFDISIHDITIDANVFWGITLNSGLNQFTYRLDSIDIFSGQVGVIVGVFGTVQDLWMSRMSIGNCTNAGIFLIDVSGFYFHEIDILQCAIGLLAFPTVHYVRIGFMRNVLCDTCTSHGFKFSTNVQTPASDWAQVYDIEMVECWASNNGFGNTSVHGFFFIGGNVAGAHSGISGVKMTNCISRGNGGDGVLVQNNADKVTQVSAHNCTFTANGKNGFETAVGVTDFSVIGGFAGVAGFSGAGGALESGNAQYGVVVNVGASDRYVIQGVNAHGNTIGAIGDGGTGTNKSVTGNIT